MFIDPLAQRCTDEQPEYQKEIYTMELKHMYNFPAPTLRKVSDTLPALWAA